MNFWAQRTKAALLETRGHTVTLPQYPGWSFTVRRMCDWNADYQRAQIRIWQQPDVAKILAKLRADPGYVLSAAERAADAATTREAFADGCLAGWSGVTDAKGKPMPCEGAHKLALLAHFPDLFAALVKAASKGENFGDADGAKTEAATAIAGN